MYLQGTPVTDEADYLPGLIKAVTTQTIPPCLWVIVDDGSKDDGVSIIEEACQKNRYVTLVRKKPTSEYGYSSYGSAVRTGFEAAISYAKNQNITYKYLGILDADIVPQETYFEKLLRSLENSERLGIVSGQLYLVENGKKKPEDLANWPRGGARLYKRQCLKEIGGIPEFANIDTITDAIAQLKGWQLARIFDAEAIHKRRTLSKKGLWYSYKMSAKSYYHLNYHPIYSLLMGLYFMVKPPFYLGVAFLTGYLEALARGEQQISDPVARDYFWKSLDRLTGKLRKAIIDRLKGVLHNFNRRS